MAISTTPGYPRMGSNRELKWALEGFWSGKRSEDDLLAAAAEVRRTAWAAQTEAGIDLVPANDASLYDHVLDVAALVGAVPERYGWTGGDLGLDTYFAMARGRPGGADGVGVTAMEMTKWFDTNYHYLVPELAVGSTFRLASRKPFDDLAAAQAAGVPAKPVLLGPVSFLRLAKTDDGSDPLALLDRLLPVYADVVSRLAAAGAAWVQLDEPILATDVGDAELAALRTAYDALAAAKGDASLLLHTAYGSVGDAFATLAALPVDGLGLDLVRGPENVDLVLRHGLPSGMWLAAGVVDGRNVWTNDLTASLDLLDRLAANLGAERLMVSTSCSLLHVPHDVHVEDRLDEIRPWLAFARQKLDEVVLLARGLNEGREAIRLQLEGNRRARAAASASAKRRDPWVQQRIAGHDAAGGERQSAYPVRAEAQRRRLALPLLPTTTIGSFPQTPELRAARRRHDAGELPTADYERLLERQVAEDVAWQEEIGLDVLVHGEPERNDMVQYFGEHLAGFAFTERGWVQSYGSRCVRPPIIYGDVLRPTPMTLRWATFAQSRSERPVKGMLTGPVTILNWSFVRDDQPRADTCRQIAFAIRDEVSDLDAAGIAVIQIDEPALREGLPLRRADQADYLTWATSCFRLAASAARDETQIHTHMCYAEFGDIIDAIEALDADVISVENARSGDELLRVFRDTGYGKGIGPGVYDIHSPRVPDAEEMAARIRAQLGVLGAEQLWVNPDCGLKTRRWQEVRPALANMVAAAREVRRAMAPQPSGTS